MESLTLPPDFTSKTEPQKEDIPMFNPQTSLENALQSLIPNQAEENRVNRMRKHLGETSKLFSDMQVETIIAEFQFLIDSWLDEFEKEVFTGMTLKEVLNEK